MRVERTNSNNNDFQALVQLLDAGLKIIDGDEAPFFAQYNKIDSIKHVVVLYDGEQAVSCGAFKEYEPGVAEIKRMFTREANRGKGFAAMVLEELEQWAAESGYTEAILETGNKMTAAIALYGKSGYERTPNYGQYIGVESSVCMKKMLKP
ncbi:N-acetyltransferase domain-containing protein [Flavobacterium longum]|uniref:GNAT family N-acetyltransferase n=1 Tax=Flavobacterium longum TaxID=1299340 RepID=UPI0039E8C8E6